MKQTLSNTKKSLGRVWFRYFQLYVVTGKLATACMDIGWTQTNVDAYARGHYHLVNQQMANMVMGNVALREIRRYQRSSELLI